MTDLETWQSGGTRARVQVVPRKPQALLPPLLKWSALGAATLAVLLGYLGTTLLLDSVLTRINSFEKTINAAFDRLESTFKR